MPVLVHVLHTCTGDRVCRAQDGTCQASPSAQEVEDQAGREQARDHRKHKHAQPEHGALRQLLAHNLVLLVQVAQLPRGGNRSFVRS